MHCATTIHGLLLTKSVFIVQSTNYMGLSVDWPDQYYTFTSLFRNTNCKSEDLRVLNKAQYLSLMYLKNTYTCSHVDLS